MISSSILTESLIDVDQQCLPSTEKPLLKDASNSATPNNKPEEAQGGEGVESNQPNPSIIHESTEGNTNMAKTMQYHERETITHFTPYTQEDPEQSEKVATGSTPPTPEVNEETAPTQENIATTDTGQDSREATKKIVILSSPKKKIHLTMRLSRSPSVTVTETQRNGGQNNTTSCSTTTFIDSSHISGLQPSVLTTENVTKTQSTNISVSNAGPMEQSVTDDTISSALANDHRSCSDTTNGKLSSVHYIALDKSGHPYCKYCGQKGGFTPADYAANDALVPPVNPKIYLVQGDGEIVKEIRVVAANGKVENPNKKRKIAEDKKKIRRRRARKEKADDDGNFMR